MSESILHPSVPLRIGSNRFFCSLFSADELLGHWGSIRQDMMSGCHRPHDSRQTVQELQGLHLVHVVRLRRSSAVQPAVRWSVGWVVSTGSTSVESRVDRGLIELAMPAPAITESSSKVGRVLSVCEHEKVHGVCISGACG